MRAWRYRGDQQRLAGTAGLGTRSWLLQLALLYVLLPTLPVTPRPIAPEDCFDVMQEIHKHFNETTASNIKPHHKDNQHLSPEVWNELIGLHEKLPEGTVKSNYPKVLRVLLTAAKEANKTDVKSTRHIHERIITESFSNDGGENGTTPSIPLTNELGEMQDFRSAESLTSAHSHDHFVMSVTPPQNISVNSTMIKTFSRPAYTMTPYIITIKNHTTETYPSERLSANLDETDIKTFHAHNDETGLYSKLKTEDSSNLTESTTAQTTLSIYTPQWVISDKTTIANEIITSTSSIPFNKESTEDNISYEQTVDSSYSSVNKIKNETFESASTTTGHWKSDEANNASILEEGALNSSGMAEGKLIDSFITSTPVVEESLMTGTKIANVDVVNELPSTIRYPEIYTTLSQGTDIELDENSTGVTSVESSLQGDKINPISEMKVQNDSTSSDPTSSDLYSGRNETVKENQAAVPTAMNAGQKHEEVETLQMNILNVTIATTPVVITDTDPTLNFSSESKANVTDSWPEKMGHNTTENVTSITSELSFLHSSGMHEGNNSNIQENEHSGTIPSETLTETTTIRSVVTESSTVPYTTSHPSGTTSSGSTPLYTSTNGHNAISTDYLSHAMLPAVENTRIASSTNDPTNEMIVTPRENNRNQSLATTAISSTPSSTSILENTSEISTASKIASHQPDYQITSDIRTLGDNYSSSKVRTETTTPTVITTVVNRTLETPSLVKSSEESKSSLIATGKIKSLSSKTTASSSGDFSDENWTTFKVPARQQRVPVHDILKHWPSLSYI